MAVDQTTVNPLAEGLDRERHAPPGVLVVFGASGDLTSRKLMPAIERLSRRGLLPPAFSVVGIARTEMSDDDFRKRMLDAIADAGPGWSEQVKHFRYVAVHYAHPDTSKKLKQLL